MGLEGIVNSQQNEWVMLNIVFHYFQKCKRQKKDFPLKVWSLQDEILTSDIIIQLFPQMLLYPVAQLN